MKRTIFTGCSIVALLGILAHPAAADEFGLSASASADTERGAEAEGAATATAQGDEGASAAAGDDMVPEPPPPPEQPVDQEPARAAAAARTTTAQVDGQTDHDQMVGNFAIGYLGYRQMFIAAGAGGNNGQVTAPVIGLRYWMNPGMGFDAGLGFSTSSSTVSIDSGATTTETDSPGPLTLILHGGLPLALATSSHFTFQVVPELNLGYATNTVEGGPAGDQVFHGLHFDLGARAGAEIQFGFIDIPQLSLQAGIGLALAYDSTSYEDDNTTDDWSQTSLGTGVGDNPWNIFTANIAALYYFDE